MSTSFKIKGIEVEMWETSFRVDGMADVVYIGHHCTQAHVSALVESIYNAVHRKAVKAGKIAVADAARTFVMDKLDL